MTCFLHFKLMRAPSRCFVVFFFFFLKTMFPLLPFYTAFCCPFPACSFSVSLLALLLLFFLSRSILVLLPTLEYFFACSSPEWLLGFCFCFVFVTFRLARLHSSKESAWQCRSCRRLGFDPWVGKIPWRWEGLPSPVFWPGKFHGQRKLAGYSPWVAESDMTFGPEFAPTAHPRCYF